MIIAWTKQQQRLVCNFHWKSKKMKKGIFKMLCLKSHQHSLYSPYLCISVRKSSQFVWSIRTSWATFGWVLIVAPFRVGCKCGSWRTCDWSCSTRFEQDWHLCNKPPWNHQNGEEQWWISTVSWSKSLENSFHIRKQHGWRFWGNFNSYCVFSTSLD